MERKTIWKNFLILALGSLIVFHVDMANANEDTSQSSSTGDEECVLEGE